MKNITYHDEKYNISWLISDYIDYTIKSLNNATKEGKQVQWKEKYYIPS